MQTNDLWDTLIVGQGLAGTTLGWHLHEMGWRVLLIDRDEPITSSKIAAGLITPITGQRLVLSQDHQKLLPIAREFYARIEGRTGQRLFYERQAARLFQSEDESARFAQRLDNSAYKAFLTDPQPALLLDPDHGEVSLGGFEMESAQLDVAAYLAASRAALPFVRLRLDWAQDVRIGAESIEVGGHRARFVISCEGYAASRNPYFSYVPFIAAKGDILTVRFDQPLPPRVIHRGIWIAPTSAPDIFKVGSTYDWKSLDQKPSTAARAEIEAKLQAFFRVPYSIMDHQAAVRPIIHRGDAVIGLHPAHDRLGYFNGLGSKGSLTAPFFARTFADFLVRGLPLAEAFDLRKRF